MSIAIMREPITFAAFGAFWYRLWSMTTQSVLVKTTFQILAYQLHRYMPARLSWAPYGRVFKAIKWTWVLAPGMLAGAGLGETLCLAAQDNSGYFEFVSPRAGMDTGATSMLVN